VQGEIKDREGMTDNFENRARSEVEGGRFVH